MSHDTPWPAPADILGRDIREGDVLWIAVGRGSSAATMEQRRVVSVDPPLRTWQNRDVPDGELAGRVRVRWEPGLVGPGWRRHGGGGDAPGRAVHLVYPGRALLHPPAGAR